MIYAQMLNENLTYKNCPVILANSIEYRNLKVSSQKEAETLQKIKRDEEL